MATPEEAKEIARRFIDEVFNKRNLKHAEEVLSEGFTEHSPPFPGMGNDKASAIEGFRLLLDSSDDLRVEIVDLVSNGGRIAIRGRYSGTDTGGSAPGGPPPRQRVPTERRAPA